jgi:hypothetical protein
LTTTRSVCSLLVTVSGRIGLKVFPAPVSADGPSKNKIGERADEMAAEIRALMAKLAPDGQFTEIVATQALIATRE